MYIFGNGGFTLDGIPAKDLNIIMSRESNRPILPNTVDSTLSIPGRNGIIDMGATLGARMFNLKCNVVTKDYRTLQSAIEKFASVLLDKYGKPKQVKLIFDVNPDRYYLVRYSGSLGIDRIFGLGQFNLPLLCADGCGYEASDKHDEIFYYDTGIEYDIGLYYPNPTSFEWLYIEQHSSLMNYSSYNTDIVIEIEGSVEGGSIEHIQSGKILTLPSFTNKKMVIDYKKLTIKVDGLNGLIGSNGEFFDLETGENQLIFRADVVNAIVSYKWEHKFY